MGLGKTYSTSYLADSNNNTGVDGQVLISTATGINWSDGANIIGGPFLPLSAGAGFPLTGTLSAGDIVIESGSKLFLNNSVNTASGSIVCPGGGSLALQSYGNNMIYLNENAEIRFSTSSSQRMVINAAGNVGIGTTNPFEKVDVVGNIYAQNRIISADVSLPNENLLPEASIKFAGQNDIYNNSTKTVISPYEARWVNTTGSTTIRATTATLVSGEVYTVSIYYKDLIGSLTMDLGDTALTGSYTSAAGTSSVPTSGRIYGRCIRNVNNYEFIDVNLSNLSEVTLLNIKLEQGSVVTEFIATPETQAVPQTLTTNNIITTGSVGIGTTSPSQKLEVNGIARAEAVNVYGAGDSSSTSPQIYSPSTGAFAISGNGSEQMRITSAGYVGIGTTAPGAKLTIADPGGATTRSIQIEGNTSFTGINGTVGVFSNGTYLSTNYYYDSAQVKPVTAFGQVAVIQQVSQTSGNNFIDFAVSDHTDPNSAPDSRMRILDTGNVGIGTTSPNGKLQVDGDIYVNGADKKIMSYSGAVDYGTLSNNSVRFNANGSEKMRITAAGNVGIGATSPVSTLEVSKNQNGQGITITQENAGDGYHSKLTFRGSDGSGGFVQTAALAAYQQANAAGGRLRLFGGTTEGLQVKTNGSIQLPTYGAGTLVTDASGNITVSSGGGEGGPYLPLTGGTLTGDLIIESALLSNQENTDVDTGTETVASARITSYTAAFFDFVIKNGTNLRAGTVFACHDGTNVAYTETSTNDLGDTSDVTLSVDISGNDMRLRATVTSDNWIIKSLIRAI